MSELSAPGRIVRRHDPDRFFTALFAPAPRREALFTLYAFNHELARAREAAREPMAALIRLQWWREVLDGKRVRHEVAGPLGDALEAGALDAGLLGGLVEAREAETEAMPDLVAFERYVLGTAGVMVAAGRALRMGGGGNVAAGGGAYGVAGVLLSAPALARQGRSVLPVALLGPGGGVTAEGRERLLELGRTWLPGRVAVPRPALAAALPVVLARRRLRGRGEGTVGGDRLAVLRAAMTGRP